MDFLTDWLTGWLKDLLIDGIMGNLGGLFDNVNASVGDVAAQVGTTPAAWNAGVFSLGSFGISTDDMYEMNITTDQFKTIDYDTLFKLVYTYGSGHM